MDRYLKNIFVSFRILNYVSLGFFILLSACTEKNYKVGLQPSTGNLEIVDGPTSGVKVDTSSLNPNIVQNLEKITSANVGKSPIGSTSVYTVYLRNNGGLPATITSLSIQPPEAADHFTPKMNCQQVDGNFSVCPIDIWYNPQIIGKVNAQLEVNFNSEDTPQIRKLTLDLSGNSVNLGFLTFDNKSASDFTVQPIDLHDCTSGGNYSVSALVKIIYNGAHIKTSGIQITTPPYDFSINTTDPTQFTFDPLGTGGSTCKSTITSDCYIKVYFTAKALGSQLANLVVRYSNGPESISLSAPMKGNGLHEAVLATLSATSLPSPFDIGRAIVATDTSKNPPVINIQTIEKDIPITYIPGSGPKADGVQFSTTNSNLFSIDFSKSTCKNNATIDTSCNLHVVFKPTALGNATDTIKVTYKSNGQEQPSFDIPITATGIKPAILELVSTTPLSFITPAYFAVPSQTFQIKNTGDTQATQLLPSSFLISDAHFSVSLSNGSSCQLNGTLDAGGTAKCDLIVSANPNPKLNLNANSQNNNAPVNSLFSGGLSLNYNDGLNNQQIFKTDNSYFNINIQQPAILTNITSGTMTVTNGIANISGGTIDFGLVMIGATSGTLDTFIQPIDLKVYGSETLINTNAMIIPTFATGTAFGYYGSTNLFPGIAKVSTPSDILCSNPLNLDPNSVFSTTSPGPFNKCRLYLGVKNTTQSSGIRSENLVFNYLGDNNGTQYPSSGQKNLTVAVNANFQPRPTMSILPSTPFNVVSRGDTRTSAIARSFSVKNNSSYFATSVTASTFTISGTGFSKYTSTTCSSGLPIAKSGNCIIGVQLNTSVSGNYAGTLKLNYNNQIENIDTPEINFGAVVTDNVTLVPSVTTISFGTYYIGDPAPSPIPVSIAYYGNTTSALLNTGLPSQVSLDQSNCANLNAGGVSGGASCKLYFSYNTPTTPDILSNGTVNFTYSNPAITSASFGINLSVTAINKFATLTAAPTTGTFGTVYMKVAGDPNPSYADRVITITNTATMTVGKGTATQLVPTLTGTGFSIVYDPNDSTACFASAGDLTKTLTPVTNNTCTVKLRFTPTAIGLVTGSFKMGYTDPSNGAKTTSTLTLSGSGDYNKANLVFAPASPLTFATATAPILTTYSSTQQVTLKNIASGVGASNANNFTASISDPYKFDSTGIAKPCVQADGSTNAVQLASNETCLIGIKFSPTTAGTFAKTLTINFNDESGSHQILYSLTGYAADPAAHLNISALSFGKILLNDSTEKIFTLTNDATSAIKDNAYNLRLSFDGATSQYSVVNDPTLTNACINGDNLNVGSSCKIKIKFNPTILGSTTNNLVITYTDTASKGSDKTYKLAMSGIGIQMIQVYAGSYQTCIVNELNKVLCWGNNNYGQLGRGTTSVLATSPQNAVATDYLNLGGDVINIKKIAIGNSHVCALVDTLTQTGAVSCWGSNVSGRLGLESADTSNVLKPILNSNNLKTISFGIDPTTGKAFSVLDLAVGSEHSCVILANNKIKCWGGNGAGQLGLDHSNSIGNSAGSMGDQLAYIKLNSSSSAISISAGAGHSCAAFADGTSKCWGNNSYGQLGQGADPESFGSGVMDSNLQKVFMMSEITNINLGNQVLAKKVFASQGAHTCIVTSDDQLKCFGKTVDDENAPMPFYGILGTCWARASYNSTANSCWTNLTLNKTSRLGYYQADMGDHLPYIQFANGVGTLKLKQFAAGNYFSCALLADDTIRCWGLNNYGQLGNTQLSNIGMNQNDMGVSLAPTLTSYTNTNNVVVKPLSIASGAEHACAVMSDNTLKCWGTSLDNPTGLGYSNVTATDYYKPKTSPVVYDGFH